MCRAAVTAYVRNGLACPAQSAPAGTGVPRAALALGLMGFSPTWHEPEGNGWKREVKAAGARRKMPIFPQLHA
jgi:hypothetical protein